MNALSITHTQKTCSLEEGNPIKNIPETFDFAVRTPVCCCFVVGQNRPFSPLLTPAFFLVLLRLALVKHNRARYFAATSNPQKKEVTEEIVCNIYGNFLKRNGKNQRIGWIVVDKHTCRVKVAQALQYRQRISDDGSFIPLKRNKVDTPSVVGSSMDATRRTVSIGSDVGAFTYVDKCPPLETASSDDPMLFRNDCPPLSVTSLCNAHVMQKFHQHSHGSLSPSVTGSVAEIPFPALVVSSNCSNQETMSLAESDDDHFYETCSDDESELISDKELLWALGYPVTADTVKDVYQNSGRPSRTGFSPKDYMAHRRDSFSYISDSNLYISLENRQSMLDLEPIALQDAMVSLSGTDVFSALESAGFFDKNKDCSLSHQ